MSTMTVLFLRRLGQPLGALSTTVPGDSPALEPELGMAIPVPDPSRPGSTVLQPVTVRRDDLEIASLESELVDPGDIFQWRVVTTRGPDGSQLRQLDRLGAGSVTFTGTNLSNDLLLDVPKLGHQDRLYYEVRNQAGVSLPGVLIFGPADRKTEPVHAPDTGAYIAFVEGYPPAILQRVTVTRGTVGVGLDLALTVPRLGERGQLAYRIKNVNPNNNKNGMLQFQGTVHTIQEIVTVADNTAYDVTVEGYPPMTVPPA